MSNQFRPVQPQGERKASNPQFRANYELVSRRPPTPVVPPRPANACKGKDDTCKAFAVKGGDLCAGHAASARKKLEEVVADETG